MARISQAAAQEATDKITAKLKDAITVAAAEKTKYVSALYLSKLPRVVAETFKAHPLYFHTTKRAHVVGHGCNVRYADMDDSYPYQNDYNVEPTKDEAKKLTAIISKIEKAEEDLQKADKEIYNLILSLGTHKRIADEFPEALPYLPAASGSNTAMIVAIQPIRDKVKKLVAA